jgi:DNA-directed RNA polymerase beta subunit
MGADESADIEVEPASQHNPGVNIDATLNKKYKISFGQIYLAKPMMTESDGETGTLFPKEARLRNLTCVRLFHVASLTPSDKGSPHCRVSCACSVRSVAGGAALPGRTSDL